MGNLSDLKKAYITSDATVEASDLLHGVIAYGPNGKVGTPLPNVAPTVLMQSDLAVNDAGNGITLTNLGSVTKTVDGFASGIPSFVFTRSAAQGIGIDDDPALDIGTGDYTVESWLKTTSGSIVSQAPSLWANDRLADNGTGNPRIMILTQVDLFIGTYPLEGTINVSDGEWHHIAVTRESGVTKLWIDGYLDGSTTDMDHSYSTNGMGILDWDSNGSIDGEIAMWRFTNGTARYTAPFKTPRNML